MSNPFAVADATKALMVEINVLRAENAELRKLVWEACDIGWDIRETYVNKEEMFARWVNEHPILKGIQMSNEGSAWLRVAPYDVLLLVEEALDNREEMEPFEHELFKKTKEEIDRRDGGK